MNEIRILGIAVTDNAAEAIKVQNLLTKFGCTIKTRLGLHEVSNDECNSEGIILLELTGNTDEMDKLENELLKIESLKLRKMIF
jgi:hypothetical protein